MSVNYQDWQAKTMSVGSLFLDPENPRIPPGRKFDGERALIEELTLHEDIYELATKIAENGFFPSEPLVAVKEDGRTIVAEGNRRLAASKLLVTPDLAPVEMVKRFRTLAAAFDSKLLAKLPVVIAPTREATIPLIIARHTATQIAKWQPAMQAHFYSNLQTHGLTVEEVAKKFSLKPAEVREALHTHNLYKMACRLDLPADEREVVNDPRKFNLTTLGRVFDTPFARQFFGLAYADNGTIRGEIDPQEFKKGFKRLVTDIAKRTQTSRTLDKAEDIKRYLNNLPEDARPNPRKKGTFDSDSFLTPGRTAPQAGVAKPTRKPRSSGPRLGLIPIGMHCNARNQRVKNLFQELQKLPVQKFPNASALTFRSFLEISVYCFLDEAGQISVMQKEYLAEIQRRNAGKPPAKQRNPEPNWTPNLHDMMGRISDPKQTSLANKHTVKALSKVINEEKELFGWNLSTHNSTYHPTESRLRSTWSNLEEFFTEILA